MDSPGLYPYEIGCYSEGGFSCVYHQCTAGGGNEVEVEGGIKRLLTLMILGALAVRTQEPNPYMTGGKLNGVAWRLKGLSPQGIDSLQN